MGGPRRNMARVCKKVVEADLPPKNRQGREADEMMLLEDDTWRVSAEFQLNESKGP